MQPITCFIEVDLIQAEWVVTAYCAEDARMIEVVEQRLDPHTRTGSLVSGAPEDFVIHENELVGHATDPLVIADLRRKLPVKWGDVLVSRFFLPRTMSVRQCGKKGNHSLNYGEGYRGFALIHEMDESDAKHVVTLYRDVAYPGVKRFWSWVERQLHEDNRRLTNCFGQTRQFLDRWGPDLLRKAYAFIPQSTVGNIANFGLRGVYHDTQDCMDKVIPAAQVHDSILCQLTFDSWLEASHQVARCRTHMTHPCTYHGVEFTIRTSVKLGRTWGEKHMIELKQEPDDFIEASTIEEAWEASCAA